MSYEMHVESDYSPGREDRPLRNVWLHNATHEQVSCTLSHNKTPYSGPSKQHLHQHCQERNRADHIAVDSRKPHSSTSRHLLLMVAYAYEGTSAIVVPDAHIASAKFPVLLWFAILEASVNHLHRPCAAKFDTRQRRVLRVWGAA